MRRRGLNSALSLFVVLATIAAAPQFAAATNTGSSPCIANVQTTSTVVTASAGGYCYIAFLSSTNTWTTPSGLTSANIVVIAGGGAGGSGAWAGGGGAGGIVYIAGKSLTPLTSYSLSIGGGGSAGAANLDGITNRSNNGDDSWFGSSTTFLAKGGGAGASYAWGTGSAPYSACDGNSGGSGGGAPECNNATYTNVGGATTQTLPAGATAIYGNAGGSTPIASYASGGGGGGAGAAGTAVTTSSTAGAGGAGTNAFSTWLSALTSAMSGVSGWSTATAAGYIAGGGGGSANTRGAGGVGGGGIGGNNSVIAGAAGTTNTGSGGGGAGYNGSSGTGGAGGSGIIMIQYASQSSLSLALAGNPTSVQFNRYINLTATITGSDGKITFYVDGKVISGCRSKQTSSLTYTCPWKPSFHKLVTLTATLINGTTSYASPLAISVVKRVNTR